MKTPELYIGTAGWSYKDWVPNFYPRSQSKDFSWLQFYSQYFNVVEVNASYYTYLNPRVVKSWLNQIEDVNEFLFTVKLHQDFTHKRIYTSEQTAAVKHNLDMLKDNERLGGLLLQFPYSFECSDANIEYLAKLIRQFEEYEKFVEVRHKSWQNKKASTVTFCTIDQPQIGESIDFNPVIGNGAAYIRFHGRNEDAWLNSIKNFGKRQTYEEQSARYKYLYSPGELAEIDYKIKEIFDKVKKVFVIMNNHPHGDAVANAFELIHLLRDKVKIEIPGTIINAYPRLNNIAIN
ncbi:MAG: DUF72 domain-containing protein [Candidatus Cloacimonetes bacterium]|nr:DUF72 domain-containing protein [Candidatus Cloacimonadota bacterium]MCF8393993.1 DUF72 domain-containing protein [Melioribacteraceae bacterium]